MLHKLTAATVFGMLIGVSAHAELYKKIDEQGNITYSDVPSGTAKPVKPPGLSTYGTPAQHKQSTKKPPDTAKPAAANYTALAITSPAHDETLRDNSGAVAVKVSVVPQLDTQAGHTLVVLLDAKSAAQAQAAEVSLHEVERGAHTLKVQVTDASGRVLKESAEISFQLHRGPGVAARKAGK